MSKSVSFKLIAALFVVVPLARADQPAVTVYNQNFGVVRERLSLELIAGVNEISFDDVTAHLEPDSVILRDPLEQRRIQILEQNYRADPLSQPLLLSLFEGQTIDFQIGAGPSAVIVPGRIVRSGYVPHPAAWQQYGQAYRYTQMMRVNYAGGGNQPLIEIDGKLRFGLPGTPLFPSLHDDTILKPTLHWLLETDTAGPLEAELSYVTGGMSWKADYNVVSPETEDVLDLVGWVTIDNQSGKDFNDARIKLMAGDVSKLLPSAQIAHLRSSFLNYNMAGGGPMAPPVSEKAFDEYHLYTLRRPTTLRDRQTKQVEFVRAGGVGSRRLYVYDGYRPRYNQYQGWSWENIRNQEGFGTLSGTKVSVMREIENSEANGLGIPLPAGRVRFYRRDEDGQLEFVGENLIDHTPKDETLRIYTGNAFDLVGQRRRTNFKIDHGERYVDESFEIKVRNHKTVAVEVRVVEHLYRWYTWTIQEKSQDFAKLESQTIEFRVKLQPDEEKTVTYKVHYSW